MGSKFGLHLQQVLQLVGRAQQEGGRLAVARDQLSHGPDLGGAELVAEQRRPGGVCLRCGGGGGGRRAVLQVVGCDVLLLALLLQDRGRAAREGHRRRDLLLRYE
jgi:hypothetical protein